MIVFTDTAPAVTPIDPQPMLAALRREAVILQARGTACGEQVCVSVGKPVGECSGSVPVRRLCVRVGRW